MLKVAKLCFFFNLTILKQKVLTKIRNLLTSYPTVGKMNLNFRENGLMNISKNFAKVPSEFREKVLTKTFAKMNEEFLLNYNCDLNI